MEAAGYDYDVVQAEINRIVNGGVAKADNDNSVDDRPESDIQLLRVTRGQGGRRNIYHDGGSVL